MNTVVTSKEAILEASRTLAAAQGLSAISMRGVAQACGIAVGSVYNYFPSKTDLLVATVESIWRSVFHTAAPQHQPANFADRITWLYDSIRNGTREYPSFFSLHSIGFSADDVSHGRNTMHQYFAHMKAGLLQTLEQDTAVRPDAFDETFTPQALVEFVFSGILSALARGENDFSLLCCIVRRLIYPI